MTFREECEELDTFAEVQKRAYIEDMDYICAFYAEAYNWRKEYEKTNNIPNTPTDKPNYSNILSDMENMTWTQTKYLKKSMKSNQKSKKPV